MYECPGEYGEVVEYRTISPEGRVPSLRVGDRLLTQAAAILEYMEDTPALAGAINLMPTDPWARARVRQICWLLGADTHPLQNMGMLRTAVADFGLPAPAGGLQTHPFRQHYLRRALAALDGILGESFLSAAHSWQPNNSPCLLHACCGRQHTN